MSQNVPTDTPFRWTAAKEQAAALLAADSLTDEQIAAKAKITRRQLVRWKQTPAFADRIASIVEKARAALERRGISDLANRVAAANARWLAMQEVITARAADGKEHPDVPGAATGLLVAKLRVVRVEDDSEDGARRSIDVMDWAVDVGLIHALQSEERQTAQMLGEWSEKRELTGPAAGPIVIEYVNDWRAQPDES